MASYRNFLVSQCCSQTNTKIHAFMLFFSPLVKRSLSVIPGTISNISSFLKSFKKSHREETLTNILYWKLPFVFSFFFRVWVIIILIGKKNFKEIAFLLCLPNWRFPSIWFFFLSSREGIVKKKKKKNIKTYHSLCWELSLVENKCKLTGSLWFFSLSEFTLVVPYLKAVPF